MSLFERIQSKRYDLQEIKKKYGPEYKDRLKRSKRFKQSFGTPTGADPKTGEPVYNPSYTIDAKGKKNLGPDIELPRSRTGGVPTNKAYDTISKKLGDREAAKKIYIDPKTGKASDEGIKQYIRKSRQMSSGSNVPIDDKEVEKIYKKQKKEFADKINQKYGGRRATLQGTKAKKFANTATSGAKRKAFKKFASKQVGKGFKYLKGAAAKNPLVAGAIALGVGAYAINKARKALGPKTLDMEKDFTKTAPIKYGSASKASDRPKGKNIGDTVRFQYARSSDKKVKDKAGPYLKKDQLDKFKSGKYTVSTKSGQKINVADRLKNSAFAQQVKKARQSNKKKDQAFLKSVKNSSVVKGL